jgi:hypothetical protein
LFGALEIDHVRGVIYFHSTETGASVLRICALPAPIPHTKELLDITHMQGCSWQEVKSNVMPLDPISQQYIEKAKEKWDKKDKKK